MTATIAVIPPRTPALGAWQRSGSREKEVSQVLMFVYEVMTKAPLTVDARTSGGEAAALMRAEQADALVVVDRTQVVGLLTAASLLALLDDRSDVIAVPVSSLCSRVLCTVAPDAEIVDAQQRMLRLAVDQAVVMDDGELVGVVGLEQLSTVLTRTR